MSMKSDTVRDLEKLYGQVQEYLEGEKPADLAMAGPSRVEYCHNFRTVPEKYLLKDNLLLLLKET
jgi:hypothetical protein